MALHSTIDAVQLPCQKSPSNKQLNGPIIPKNSRGVVWDDLKDTLKLKQRPNALKVAADSCCGDKPYSSAISQCCLGRVIPLNQVCCLNGKHVSESQLCHCVPPSTKWSQIESRRLSALSKVVHRLGSSLGATITVMEDRQKTLSQQLFDLDQSGVHLMDNFYKLIGIERGDPEASAIEHSLLHGPRRQQRRRMRRNYRFVDEYIPSEYAYEYEAEYDYEAEPGVEMFEDAVMPLYGTDEIIYDEETELADYDQINLEKAKINVHERQVIRARMEKLGVEQNEVEGELNSLRTLSISLRASKAPIDNLEEVVRSSNIVQSNTDHHHRQCQMDEWKGHFQQLLDAVFTVYDHSTTHDLEGTSDTITLSELRRIQYFHENYKRENSDYTDEENAEFINDE